MALRKVNTFQERVVIPYDHPALTTSVAVKIFPTTNKLFRVDSVKYNNPTGLAEDATNSFRVEVKKTSAVALTGGTFTATNATELFTKTAHGYLTGDGPVQVSNSGGALPAGLAAATDYYIIKNDANSFFLATTRGNAVTGTKVAISTDGTGTQTIIVTNARRFVTIATGVDTDSALPGTNTLNADQTIAMTLTATSADLTVDAGTHVYFVATLKGTQTLPAGRLVVEGRYL